jgi:hypothetical protein
LNNISDSIFVSASLLKKGSNKRTTNSDNKIAKVQSAKDSPKNFLISSPLLAPNTFCTPVSLARPNAPAVVRFIKLKQAISKIMAAIPRRLKTILLLLALKASPNKMSDEYK